MSCKECVLPVPTDDPAVMQQVLGPPLRGAHNLWRDRSTTAGEFVFYALLSNAMQDCRLTQQWPCQWSPLHGEGGGFWAGIISRENFVSQEGGEIFLPERRRQRGMRHPFLHRCTGCGTAETIAGGPIVAEVKVLEVILFLIPFLSLLLKHSMMIRCPCLCFGVVFCLQAGPSEQSNERLGAPCHALQSCNHEKSLFDLPNGPYMMKCNMRRLPPNNPTAPLVICNSVHAI